MFKIENMAVACGCSYITIWMGDRYDVSELGAMFASFVMFRSMCDVRTACV